MADAKRSPQSFGVAGVLAPGCSVYYGSLFSPRHVGRVTDLLAARLASAGLDELKLRAAILFTAFEAYRSQAAAGSRAPLPEPLVIECGVDPGRVAVGVSFTLAPTLEMERIVDTGLRDRILGGAGSGEFELLLIHLLHHSHRLILRVQPSTRRVEIVATIAIPGKVDPAEIAVTSFEVVILGENLEPSVEPAEHVEVGDLDYPTLLSEDSPGRRIPAVRTGEFLVRAVEDVRITAGAREKESSQVVKGGELASDAIQLVKGSRESTDDTIVKLSGPGIVANDSSLRVATSARSDDMKELLESDPRVRAYVERISGLQARIDALETERAAAASRVVVEKVDAAPASELAPEAEGLADRLRSMWPFKTQKLELPAETVESSPGPSIQTQVDSRVDEAQHSKAGDASLSLDPTDAAGSPELAARSLVAEIQSGSLDRAIQKAQTEAGEIKRELNSPRAKRWMDGLMTDLVSEKSRLQEMAKKLGGSVRQKELEFRNRELVMQEELRRRDEMVRQKNSALSRTKEQLAQVNLNLERLKAQGQGGGAEDPHLKTKLQQSQKLLTVVKDENVTLREKVEELKDSLSAAQAQAASARKAPSPQELAALQAKSERATRQVEELKRANQVLTEKLAQQEKKERLSVTPTAAPAVGATDETKRKLDAALKFAHVVKRESEQLKLQLDELRREEERLKRELVMTQAELRILRNPGRPGGSSAA